MDNYPWIILLTIYAYICAFIAAIIARIFGAINAHAAAVPPEEPTLYAGSPLKCRQLLPVRAQIESLGTCVIATYSPYIAALFSLQWTDADMRFYCNAGRYTLVEWRQGAFRMLARATNVYAVTGEFTCIGGEFMLPLVTSSMPVQTGTCMRVGSVYEMLLREGSPVRMLPHSRIGTLHVDEAAARAVLSGRVDSVTVPRADLESIMKVGRGMVHVDAYTDGDDSVTAIVSVITTHDAPGDANSTSMDDANARVDSSVDASVNANMNASVSADVGADVDADVSADVSASIHVVPTCAHED